MDIAELGSFQTAESTIFEFEPVSDSSIIDVFPEVSVNPLAQAYVDCQQQFLVEQYFVVELYCEEFAQFNQFEHQQITFCSYSSEYVSWVCTTVVSIKPFHVGAMHYGSEYSSDITGDGPMSTAQKERRRQLKSTNTSGGGTVVDAEALGSMVQGMLTLMKSESVSVGAVQSLLSSFMSRLNKQPQQEKEVKLNGGDKSKANTNVVAAAPATTTTTTATNILCAASAVIQTTDRRRVAKRRRPTTATDRRRVEHQDRTTRA